MFGTRGPVSRVPCPWWKAAEVSALLTGPAGAQHCMAGGQARPVPLFAHMLGVPGLLLSIASDIEVVAAGRGGSSLQPLSLLRSQQVAPQIALLKAWGRVRAEPVQECSQQPRSRLPRAAHSGAA